MAALKILTAIIAVQLILGLLVALSPLYLITYPFIVHDQLIAQWWSLDQIEEEVCMYDNWYGLPPKGHWDVTDPQNIKQIKP